MEGKKIIWFSRHEPLKSQITELKRLFGNDVKIVKDSKPFSSAEEVATGRRYKFK